MGSHFGDRLRRELCDQPFPWYSSKDVERDRWKSPGIGMGAALK